MGFVVLRKGHLLPAKAAHDALSSWRLLTSGVLPLLAAIVSSALLGLRRYSDALGWQDCTVALVADPPAQLVRPAALLSVRFLRLAVVFAVLASSYMDAGFEIEPEGSKGIKVRIWGAGRFATFTVWCWTLQGVYFALTCYCFFCLPATGGIEASNDDFSLLAAVALVLFETNLATSILVTVVVTFVLFPHAMKSSVDTNYNLLCRPAALMMHNANLIFMVGELLVTGLPVYLSHFAFAVLLGCAYVVFAWVWYARVGMFFYFFL
jgi:hypothetical protein